jgi:ribonuclease HIII
MYDYNLSQKSNQADNVDMRVILHNQICHNIIRHQRRFRIIVSDCLSSISGAKLNQGMMNSSVWMLTNVASFPCSNVGSKKALTVAAMKLIGQTAVT